MNDDDIFGGRIPPQWGVMMSDHLAQLTLRKMQTQGGNIMDTLLQMANMLLVSNLINLFFSAFANARWKTPNGKEFRPN